MNTSRKWLIASILFFTAALTAPWTMSPLIGSALWLYGRAQNGSSMQIANQNLQLPVRWWIQHIDSDPDRVIVSRIPSLGEDDYLVTVLFKLDEMDLCDMVSGLPGKHECPQTNSDAWTFVEDGSVQESSHDNVITVTYCPKSKVVGVTNNTPLSLIESASVALHELVPGCMPR